jgi:hypothetical protein
MLSQVESVETTEAWRNKYGVEREGEGRMVDQA